MIAGHADIWRQRLWVWVAALTFLVLNCIGLLVYQIGYSDRVRTLRLDLAAQTQRLNDSRTERQSLENLMRQARINRERILQLYDDHFSTRRRRLTGVTAEVQLLAKRAGLVPRSISYPEEQLQQYGLVKRSFVFSVQGTYADLRKFINLLELSDSFLTLEDASLGEQTARRLPVRGAVVPVRPGFPPTPTLSAFPGGAQPGAGPAAAGPASAVLRMSLRISTLFATQDETRDALAPLPGANAVGAPRGRTP